MKKTVLRNYAKLIARHGINVQKGQDVIIGAQLDHPEFVEMLVDECYKAGARRVDVTWEDRNLVKIDARHKSVKTWSEVYDWEIGRMEQRAKDLPCRIFLRSIDPDNLKGVNVTRKNKGQQIRNKIIRPYLDLTEGKCQKCIVGVPNKKWAKKVFPDLSPAKAEEKLWEAVIAASRGDGDYKAVWEKHIRNLKARCEQLNALGIKALHFYAPNGTDLTVGMMKESRFICCGEQTPAGVPYIYNIPTEECYISPDRDKADGIVYSTMPLSYNGQMIDKFWMKFKDGAVVDYGAEEGYDTLKSMLEMDEGAKHLGECALVPFESPVRQLCFFYDVLYDENAACHLAVGRGFTQCTTLFGKAPIEEIRAKGLNSSIIHNDFMIGYDELSIDAVTYDGKTVPIFRKGTWALK